MPKELALFLFGAFIVWLFIRDRKLRPMTSGGLWLTLIWIVIIGTKPVSYWFGAEIESEEAFNYLEGSPLDRNVFLLLIVTGIAVLARRNIRWKELFAENRWLFALFLYCLVSTLWSDYPFVSFKRWTKDAGNLIMVLILLTEKEPVDAAKAVLARFLYLAVPLSVLVIKYFPDIGRYYNNYTWTVGFSGITANKNSLGSVLLLCGLFLVWELSGMRSVKGGTGNTLDMLVEVALLLMTCWLFLIAESSTALVCFILGAGILYFMCLPLIKRQVRNLGTWTLAGAFLVMTLFSFPDITKAVIGMMGRDTTLTGRTELWSSLLGMQVNPLLGFGYQSFWLGARLELLWENFNFHPVQAHNGYLETYLNIGVIGLFLLIGVLLSAGVKLKREMLAGSNYAVFRFSVLFVVILYNWTEAMFNGLNVIWILLLISALTYPRPDGMTYQSREISFPFGVN